jgi:hypothetical protein
MITIQYKKYCRSIQVGLWGFCDGMVTSFQKLFVVIQAFPEVFIFAGAVPAHIGIAILLSSFRFLHRLHIHLCILSIFSNSTVLKEAFDAKNSIPF